MSGETITILCSGVTLGVYVPALILDSRLQRLGISTDVEVYENLLLAEKREKIPEMKRSFHRNFSFARIGRKLSKENNYRYLDRTAISDLLLTWKNKKRKHFIIWSGFWLPIIEEYIEKVEFHLSIDIVNVDAVVMHSFKPYRLDHPFYRFVLLFNWAEQNISYMLKISEDEPLSYNKRTDRFLIHGGGWGIGTYKEKIPGLMNAGLNLDIIAYEREDIEKGINKNRFFLIDPMWKPWEKNKAGRHEFPRFGEVCGDSETQFQNNKLFPEVYRLVRNNRAIISKPGGGTLIDSLSSATPIVFLEPYGEGEMKNARLFEHLGLGISYQKWLDSGCALEILESLHSNLIEIRSKTKDYAEELYDAAQNHGKI